MTGADVRTATPADVARLLVLWRTAAENGGRPPDTETALVALLERDPSAPLVSSMWAGSSPISAATQSDRARGGHDVLSLRTAGYAVSVTPRGDRSAAAADVPWRPWRVAQKARSQAGESALHLSDTRVGENTVADCHGGNQFVAAVVTLHERGRLWVFPHVDQLVWRAGEPEAEPQLEAKGAAGSPVDRRSAHARRLPRSSRGVITVLPSSLQCHTRAGARRWASAPGQHHHVR